MPGATGTLAEIIDVFSCCLFTWEALVTVVPAFLLAGAIAAFVPPSLILKYLGGGARKIVSYPVAAVSGTVLSLCSCNVVPLFVSIYRTGAGIGPASTFLYAGPAINLVSLVLVFEAIGWQMGFWRAVLVPMVGVATGLTMALIFRGDAQRAEEAASNASLEDTAGLREWLLFGLLMALVIFGAVEVGVAWKIGGIAAIVASIAVLMIYRFTREDLLSWWRETWYLLKTVIPVLIPAVIVIGLLTQWIDLKWIYDNVGDNSLRSLLFADLFGELMYFPLLSEVVFAKAMMRLGLATGPAMAILLTGTGASLPGAIIIGRCVGWTKAAIFIACEIVFTTAAAWLFASEVGAYICACMTNIQ